MNWNANVQQAMWRNAALTVAYVGNKGTRLYTFAISIRTFTATIRE